MTVATFHVNHGKHVRLTEDCRRVVAVDRESVWHKTLFSAEPLEEGVPFTVKIERKRAGKSVQVCMGVTALEPEEHNPPSDAAATNQSWMLAGPHLYQHGKFVREYPGTMNTKRGDLVGMRWGDNALSFCKNHKSLGKAFDDVTGPVWAVVELWNVDQFYIVDPPSESGGNTLLNGTSRTEASGTDDPREIVLTSATPRTSRSCQVTVKKKPFYL